MGAAITLPAGQCINLNVAINLDGSGPGPPPTVQPSWTTTDSTKVAFLVGGVKNPGPVSGPRQSIIGVAAGTAVIGCAFGAQTDTTTVTVSNTSTVNVSSIAINSSLT